MNRCGVDVGKRISDHCPVRLVLAGKELVREDRTKMFRDWSKLSSKEFRAETKELAKVLQLENGVNGLNLNLKMEAMVKGMKRIVGRLMPLKQVSVAHDRDVT